MAPSGPGPGPQGGHSGMQNSTNCLSDMIFAGGPSAPRAANMRMRELLEHIDIMIENSKNGAKPSLSPPQQASPTPSPGVSLSNHRSASLYTNASRCESAILDYYLLMRDSIAISNRERQEDCGRESRHSKRRRSKSVGQPSGQPKTRQKSARSGTGDGSKLGKKRRSRSQNMCLTTSPSVEDLLTSTESKNSRRRLCSSFDDTEDSTVVSTPKGDVDHIRDLFHCSLDMNSVSGKCSVPSVSIFDDNGPPVPESEYDLDESSRKTMFPFYQTVLILFGLSLSVVMAALDVTIVAGALPSILADLGSMDKYSWIATSYMITFTAFLPLSGKISDIFGRRPVFLASVATFVLGSGLVGASINLEMLIAFRALQGLGSGGIVALIMIVINDIVSQRERGKYQGIVGAVIGVSTLLGPLLGGFFTDHLSWRWAFFINIPIGLASFVMTMVFLRIPNPESTVLQKLKRIDVPGSLLVVVITTLLLLGLNWGGFSYPWLSVPVLASLGIAFVLIVVFLLMQTYVKSISEPIVPTYLLFSSWNFSISTLCGVFFGASLNAGIFYIPLQFQVLHGDTATWAGIRMFPLLIGVGLNTILGGLITSKTGRVVVLCQVGPAIGAVGGFLFMFFGSNGSPLIEAATLFVVGTGVGLSMQSLVLVAQASVETDHQATATSTNFFFRSLGGVVSVAIMNTILNNSFSFELESIIGIDLQDVPGASNIKLRVSDMNALPPFLREACITAFVRSINKVWLALGCALIAQFISSVFLRPVVLRKSFKAIHHAAMV